MTNSFYVSPEQMIKDRGDFARKGVNRGRPIIASRYNNGVVFVALNSSSTLFKTAEIFDGIGFAGVGKYNEFEALKIAGIRLADMQGYTYSRADVSARSLAKAYAQSLGHAFTNDPKPYEVKIIVAQTFANNEESEIYSIKYDGTVSEIQRNISIGENSNEIGIEFNKKHLDSATLLATLKLSVSLLASNSEVKLSASDFEVSVVDRTNGRRMFQRLDLSDFSSIKF